MATAKTSSQKKPAPNPKSISGKTTAGKALPKTGTKPKPKVAPKVAPKAAPKKAPKAAPKKSNPAAAAPKASPGGILAVLQGPDWTRWTVNAKVYPLDVVHQASFVFIDRAYLFLDQDKDGNFLVQVKGKTPLDAPARERLLGEFANELLNHAVRRTLSKQNRTLRELILSKALFAASRPRELQEISSKVEQMNAAVSPAPASAPRPWDQATQAEQDELDRLLAEIEKDFADDPAGIAVPWDEKFGKDQTRPDGPEDGPEKPEPKPE